MDHEVPTTACLNCGKLLDAAMNANTNERPDPGSLSICLYCGAVTIFGDDLRLRPLTQGEFDELQAQPETLKFLRRASALCHFVMASRN